MNGTDCIADCIETPQSASSQQNVTGHVDTTADPVCRRCGTVNAPGTDRCGKCHRFLPRNQANLSHGLYRREQPLELRLSREQLEVGIVSDLGGEDALTVLQRATASHLGDVHVCLKLLVNDLVTRGMFTMAGNPRRSFDAYLSALDRWDRFAQRLGLERRARLVDDLRALRGERA